jgi:hypothetical protein
MLWNSDQVEVDCNLQLDRLFYYMLIKQLNRNKVELMVHYHRKSVDVPLAKEIKIILIDFCELT